MIQAGDSFRLARLKSLSDLRCAGKMLRRTLIATIRLGWSIFGTVDFAHAVRAQQGKDLMSAELLTYYRANAVLGYRLRQHCQCQAHP